ncbi:ATP-binding protein [Winogradskyella sp. ECml5-4]|uniref:ATP-binding protein n=1 Tax=Winogradskyella sp. ECml5-4 TaxID=3110975 RepID=UPI002FEFBD55
MKLNKLKLKNFRSYSQETEIDVSDLNVIIGKNDVGKSSILEALDIFFNGKPDKNDLCIENDNSRIEITCIFSDFPEQLILDDTNPTSLSDEYLLNSENKLEIKKSFPISASGSVSEESVIICDYPDNENLSDLLSKKRTTLQLQFDELGINPDGVNRNKSKELRNAIRNHFYEEGQITTHQAEIKIDGRLDNEDNRKKIWTNLKKYLPLYSLFFVDKQLNDQDSDIQDPMKEIIKEVLKRDNITPLLEQLKEAVQDASTDLADDTITKLNDLDPELAETLRSNFPKEPTWNSIFKLTLEDDRGVPLNKRGSGMRRLVLLSFFRAQVENRRTANAPNIIYALEEPETSQHPDFQLMIVNALKELSETDNAQVFFTTHNSNLAKEIPKESLRYVYSDDGQVNVESGLNDDGTDNEEIIDKIIQTLGALPDPKNKVKVLIFVEGENDINALIGLSKILYASDGNVINLENNEAVAFIPTGGSQLKFYIEKKYLDGLLQSQVHIYDSDIPAYVQSVADLNAEGIETKIGFNTIKTELENYLHHQAINECYQDLNININITEVLDDEDVPEKVAIAVHQATSDTDWNAINPDPVKTEEKQKKKISKAKRQLNNLAIEKMTVERLTERGGFDEIKSWLDSIKAFVE